MSLTGKQLRAIESLSAGYRVATAAVYASVSDTMIYRWLKNPEFKKAVEDANREILQSSTYRLTVAASDAIRLLQDVVNDSEAPKNLRIRAADHLLTHLVNYRKLYDLEDRLTQLEMRFPDDE